MKPCTKCRYELPLDEFYQVRHKGVVRRTSQCKPCLRAATRAAKRRKRAGTSNPPGRPRRVEANVIDLLSTDGEWWMPAHLADRLGFSEGTLERTLARLVTEGRIVRRVAIRWDGVGTPPFEYSADPWWASACVLG